MDEEFQNSDDEMVDVEVWEFSLDEYEIDELIQKLQELKQTKTSVSFDVDDDNELVINYSESEDEEESDEGHDESEGEE